jgi:hypothetical protein
MRFTSLTVAVATVLLVDCGSPKEATGPEPVATISDLADQWTLTAWEYRRATGTSEPIDWVHTQNLTGTLVIQPNGAFDLVVTFPWGQQHDHGQLALQGDAVYWDGENDEELVSFLLAKASLELRWPETELVDIDQDGQPEDCWLRVVWRREQ